MRSLAGQVESSIDKIVGAGAELEEDDVDAVDEELEAVVTRDDDEAEEVAEVVLDGDDETVDDELVIEEALLEDCVLATLVVKEVLEVLLTVTR